LRCKDYEEKIPNIGLISVKSDLFKEYAGDVLKDLPVLERYIFEFYSNEKTLYGIIFCSPLLYICIMLNSYKCRSAFAVTG